MLIANPIYDAVFKYLMEDMDIARRFLSRIIGEDIIELEVSPQEHTAPSKKYLVIIFRLDFKAIILTASGERKKVLIELQKGKEAVDIMRFRRYLGDNYRKEDTSIVNGREVSSAPPIITVYFLGFTLAHIPTPIMKVNREYTDLLTNQKIEAKEEFVEQLTHDSYLIQIPRLHVESRSELERLLRVFNQVYQSDLNDRLLEIRDSELGEDELLRRMADRLRRAATEEEVLREMEIEEEVDRTIEKHIRQVEAMEERVVEMAGQVEAMAGQVEAMEGQVEAMEGQVEAMTQQLFQEKKQKSEAEQKKIEAEQKKIEMERQKLEAEKQAAEKDKQIADLLRQLGDKKG